MHIGNRMYCRPNRLKDRLRVGNSVPQIPVRQDGVRNWLALWLVQKIVAVHIHENIFSWFLCVAQHGIDGKWVRAFGPDSYGYIHIHMFVYMCIYKYI